MNIEADSINAALLAPESSPGSAAFDAFLREVVREMTVKAGQKCTAIRRIFVSAGKADAVADALAEKLKGTKIGDPRQADTRMGPLVTRGQQAAAFDGIRRLATEAAIVCGGTDAPTLDGIDKNKSAFVAPTLLKLKDAGSAQAVHEGAEPWSHSRRRSRDRHRPYRARHRHAAMQSRRTGSRRSG